MKLVRGVATPENWAHPRSLLLVHETITKSRSAQESAMLGLKKGEVYHVPSPPLCYVAFLWVDLLYEKTFLADLCQTF